MIFLHSMLFLVVSVVPLVNPTLTPFFFASLIPSEILVCKSETSFSDCSKAALICCSAKVNKKLLIRVILPLKKSSIVSFVFFLDILRFACYN